MMTQRTITYAQAINEAMDLALKSDPNVFLIGEGLPDPKGVFGSTVGLIEKYGSQRVMDMPVAENALTGICIGAALRGMKPVLVHQRLDFALLSLDQIINNAAKWHYMFGGQQSVPLVIRMIIGRGWGQGAQHSQNLQAVLAHIPGLKVITPTTAYDVKGMLLSAIADANPVICLEDRWLYGLKDHVPQEAYTVPLDKANILKEGKDITVIANGYMTVEALKAAQLLEKMNIRVELVDLRAVRPLDHKAILKSVQKTKNVLAIDSGTLSGGLAAEIIASVTEKSFAHLKAPPQRLALPDYPSPSSPGLTKEYYPDSQTIALKILGTLKRESEEQKLKDIFQKEQPGDKPHDVPDLSFTGPF